MKNQIMEYIVQKWPWGVKLLLHCKVCMLLSKLEFVLVVSYQMSFYALVV